MIRLILIILVCPVVIIWAQNFSITGMVIDSESEAGLGYANIRAAGTTIGTSANSEGNYEIKLRPGRYTLIASFLGYTNDTINLDISGSLKEINFKLKQSNVSLPEITVLPGENPALRIIREAIARKNYRNSILISYEFEAYTKGIIRTQEEITTGGSGINLSIGAADTASLFISGIIENESRGYFRKPDDYKEIILSRKQTSNFPSSVNVLTGGRLIQNFYDNRINFMGNDLHGPLADDALDFYDYYIRSAAAAGADTVFRITMMPLDRNDPGFTGSIYISSKTYDLIKIDLELNRAANVGGIFDTINVYQQFDSFDQGIFMPVDYRLLAKANVLGIAKFGFELSTVLYDYKINPKINPDFFDYAVLTVRPDADNKDSIYWAGIQSIPGTEEELSAYNRIDSLNKVPVSFWDDFSFLSTRVRVAEGFSISAPLSMYHFNSIEGHALDLGLFAYDLYDYRLNGHLTGSYGFSDQRFKTDFNAAYLLGDYRTSEISVNAYNKLKVLFGESTDYNELTATILALVAKYEFQDYYYSAGFDLGASSEVLPLLELSAGFASYRDRNAYNNTEYSFFAKEDTYRINPSVDEVSINKLSGGFTLDSRKYIEDGYFRRRISQGKSYFTLSGNLSHSNTSWLNSTEEFTELDLVLDGNVRSFRSSFILFRILGIYTSGQLPYQELYALPGNIDATAKDFSFRTLNVNQILGTRLITLNVENYMRDELFRALGIPYLRSSELQLKTFFNAAYVLNNSESPSLPESQRQEFKHPFYEIGFGIGHVLIPLQIEFAWKLNYRGENNFRIGINSVVI